MGESSYYRMGTSLAGLKLFFALRLPEPQQVTFRDFSVQVPQGLGGQGRHGYIQATIMWQEVSRAQAARIRTMIDTVEATAGIGNGILYLTIPRTDGVSAGQAWIDISGKVTMPQFEPGAATHGTVFPNFIVKLNRVTVENEPSTVL